MATVYFDYSVRCRELEADNAKLRAALRQAVYYADVCSMEDGMRCMRYPPKVYTDQDGEIETHWPWTAPTDRCGEFMDAAMFAEVQ